MAQTTYNYSISTQFPGGTVEAGKLYDQLVYQYPNSKIDLYIDIAADTCNVMFDDGFYVPAYTTVLQEVIANHDGFSWPTFEPIYIAHNNTISTTSTKWVDIAGMTSTLAMPGDFTISYDLRCEIRGNFSPGTKIKVDCAAFVNGTIINESQKSFSFTMGGWGGWLLGTTINDFSLSWQGVLAGAMANDNITLRWKTATSGLYAHERNMLIQRMEK